MIDAKASGLTVTSAVDAGSGNTLTLTTTNGGPLTLSANLVAVGGRSAGLDRRDHPDQRDHQQRRADRIVEVGGASLTRANLFDDIQGFANTGTGNVSITDAQPGGLGVLADIDAGANNTLTLTTTVGAINLSANLTAASGTVDLVSAGALSQTCGVFDHHGIADRLVGRAALADRTPTCSTAWPASPIPASAIVSSHPACQARRPDRDQRRGREARATP